MQVGESLVTRPEEFESGMLLRMQCIHHSHGAEFMGLALDHASTRLPAWEVLVGDTIYFLLYTGGTWKLFDGPDLRRSSWIYDIDLVYGVTDVA